VPRDINGNTSPPSGTIVSTGETVLPSQHNPAMLDIYAMMTQSLSRDGQGGMRANLDMSGFRVSNLGAPTLPTDAALFGQTEPAKTFAIRVANYTIVAGDKNSLQRFTATVTCSLDPAATLGNGFYFTAQASGGNVTIDPSGAETINGAATIVIPDGYSTLVWCNGTAFFALQDYASVQSLATPSGQVASFARQTAPTGWLKANGSAVLRSTYSNLDAAIYVGDGLNATALFGYRCTNPGSPSTSRSTTGNFIVLPDLRGEFVRGWDDGRGIDSGRVFGTFQAGQLEAHAHIQRYSVISNRDAGVGDWFSVAAGADTNGSQTAQAGGSETRPRNISLLYCIKI
jgi:Phage-related tail fibre protein